MSHRIQIDTLTTADDVKQTIRQIYGNHFLGTGVIHVTSVWRRDASTHLTIRMGPEAPVSSFDQFALSLSRARADAIVTTGRILRQEPQLSHSLQGPGASSEGLARWRAEELGKARPPISLVLTTGRDLDFSHPLFQMPSRTILLTDRKGGWNLESRASDAGVEVIPIDHPTPQDAIGLLRSEFGCATISIEAGPSVARQYYESPVMVDELMLSVYCGEPLKPGARGLRQVTPEQIAALFREPAPPFCVADTDGRPSWEIRRYLRL